MFILSIPPVRIAQFRAAAVSSQRDTVPTMSAITTLRRVLDQASTGLVEAADRAHSAEQALVAARKQNTPIACALRVASVTISLLAVPFVVVDILIAEPEDEDEPPLDTSNIHESLQRLRDAAGRMGRGNRQQPDSKQQNAAGHYQPGGSA